MLSYGTFAAARRCLPPLLEARTPAPVRLAALRSLVTFPDREVGSLLLEHWPTFDAEARRESLAWFRPADRQALLLEAMEKGRVSPAEIGLDFRRMLLGNPAVAGRAEKLVGTTGAGDRRAAVLAYRPALGKRGNAAAGREVFRKNCVGLPPDRGRGARGGPEPGVDPHEGAEEILDQILDPNRLVEPQYFTYQILTTGGRVVDGILDAANVTSVTLRRTEGATETVLRANIESIVCTGVSLMPEGLEKVIDPETDVRPHRFLEEPVDETRHGIEPVGRPRRLRPLPRRREGPGTARARRR